MMKYQQLSSAFSFIITIRISQVAVDLTSWATTNPETQNDSITR